MQRTTPHPDLDPVSGQPEILLNERDVLKAFRVWMAGLPHDLRVKIIMLKNNDRPYFHDLIAKLPNRR